MAKKVEEDGQENDDRTSSRKVTRTVTYWYETPLGYITWDSLPALKKDVYARRSAGLPVGKIQERIVLQTPTMLISRETNTIEI